MNLHCMTADDRVRLLASRSQKIHPRHRKNSCPNFQDLWDTAGTRLLHETAQYHTRSLLDKVMRLADNETPRATTGGDPVCPKKYGSWTIGLKDTVRASSCTYVVVALRVWKVSHIAAVLRMTYRGPKSAMKEGKSSLWSIPFNAYSTVHIGHMSLSPSQIISHCRCNLRQKECSKR